MLNKLQLADFENHLGKTLRLTAGDEPAAEISIEVALTEARAGRPTSGQQRQPFSLLFRAPPGSNLPQGTYRLHLPGTGDLDILFVPVGADDAGYYLEAVFA